MAKLYVVYGTSESGDDYFIGVFSAKPNAAHLSAMVRDHAPGEIVEEGGVEVSYLSLEVIEVDGISELPEEDPRPAPSV